MSEPKWIDEGEFAWPEWQDMGKRVEVEFDDGSAIIGELIADDVGFDGEYEYPIIMIELDDGSKVSFASGKRLKRWRYL